MNKFLKVFASLLWWSFECRFALLLWESDLNTWVTFWEAKVDQIFNENHVKDQAQVDLVVLGFLEYVNTWWHKVCKNYDQGPPAASWMDIKTLMRARFVPPSSYRKELLLKVQRLHQGPMSVSGYFKELESQLRRVEIKETNIEKIKRFGNGLRRDIQDQVELYEYSHS